MKPVIVLIVLIVLIAALIICITLGLVIGATQIDFAALGAGSESPSLHIFWEIRLPRVLLAALIGLHFAASGAILQTVTRNALADPGILGISGGAIFLMTVLVLFEILFAGSEIEAYHMPLDYLPLFALAGGILGAVLVFSLAWKQGLSPRRFILIGVAVGSFFQAVALGLVFGWGPTQAELLWIWVSGSLYGATWDAVYFLLPWTLTGCLGILVGFRKIAMLRLDDSSGLVRGFAVQRWRLFSLLLACIFAGTAVGVVGPVGFVGLVVPHVARRLLPFSLAAQYVAALLIGAILAVFADAIGRYAFSPAEIPVGVLTSLIGAPFLFWLLFPTQLSRQKGA